VTDGRNLVFVILNKQRCFTDTYWRSSSRIRKKFSLDETGDALDYQRDVHPRGKVVLDI
jgi:hypothetical protein